MIKTTHRWRAILNDYKQNLNKNKQYEMTMIFSMWRELQMRKKYYGMNHHGRIHRGWSEVAVFIWTILFPTREFISFCSHRHWMIFNRYFTALWLSFLTQQTENNALHFLYNSQSDSWKLLRSISVFYYIYHWDKMQIN